MRLYWQKRPSMPWVYALVTVRAGHRYAVPGKTNVAHLLEHLMFTGTEDRDYNHRDFTQFKRWCREHGFGIVNGQTGYDAIEFFARAPIPGVPAMLDFLADLALRPLLNSGLDKEREIIRQEREDEGGDREQELQRRLHVAGLGDCHAATCHLWPKDAELDALTYDDVRAHHAGTFDPSNMNVVLVGGGHVGEWRECIESSFAPVYRDFTPAPGLVPLAFDLPSERLMVFRAGHRKHTDNLTYSWFVPPLQHHALPFVSETLEDLTIRSLRERMRAVYSAGVDITRTSDYTVISLSTSFDGANRRRVRNATERIIAGRRLIIEQAAQSIPSLLLEDQMPDYNVEQAVEYATGFINTGREPPAPARIARIGGKMSPADVADAVARLMPFDRAIVSIVENG
jgi:predicted Zn-dependent peptidase